MIRKNYKPTLALFSVSLFLLLIASHVNAGYEGFDEEFSVGDSGYSRAQNSAEEGFNELDQTDMETGMFRRSRVQVQPVTAAPVVVPKPEAMPRSRRVAKPVPMPEPLIETKKLTEIGSGIAFEFKECRKRGNELECHFDVTSRFFDRKVVFGRHYGKTTFLYDNVGNQYTCYKMKLAGKEGQRGLESQLIADTTTSAVFYFNNISTQATSIAKLEINSAAYKSGGRGENFTLKYRKLSFISE